MATDATPDVRWTAAQPLGQAPRQGSQRQLPLPMPRCIELASPGTPCRHDDTIIMMRRQIERSLTTRYD